MDEKKDFIITVFLGWLGIHRFVRKQYLIGVVYLLSFGLFGFGWAVDTFIALSKLFKPSQTVSNTPVTAPIYSPTAVPVSSPSVIKSYTCSTVGAFADSSLYPAYSREGQIAKMKSNETLYLERFEYDGSPAFYVCRSKNGVDIGCLPAQTAARIAKNYSDCTYNVVILEKKNDYNDNSSFHIRIDICK